jgi:fumarylacetoacetase
MRSGDLVGSGTLSGRTPTSLGSLLEISSNGASPLSLGNGEQRSFLEDGDELRMVAWCEREGFARIGFGECRATIVPAKSFLEGVL